MRISGLLMAIAIALSAACGQPPPAPSPTPHLEATVQAMVRTALPTAGPDSTSDVGAPGQSSRATPTIKTSTPTRTPTVTQTPAPDQTATPVTTARPTDTPVATPRVTATSIPTPHPTTTPVTAPTVPLSATEVYRLVSPSIPFIKTYAGTGSGILIEGGYVVTNYHVVWPYEQVWVVFPDGTELQNVPVVGWDPLSDLAVLGPVEVLARPLKLEDGESMPLGSELLLVGYPAEVDQFPEPSITRGILSRYREWDRLGMTYLQTDATIVGGQSGGRWSTRMGL